MANAKKLPSGSWRVQASITVNGEKQTKSFTASTSDMAKYLALEWQTHQKEVRSDIGNFTFSEAIDKYIEDRKNVLSPTTIAGYEKIKRNHFKDIMNLKLNHITPQLIQREINNQSIKLSPKTVINHHGFLASVIGSYLDNFNPRTRLPSKQKQIRELPEPSVIFNFIKGTPIELPCILSMWLSLSMSELRGLTKSKSIKNGYIYVKEVIVDVEGVPTVKLAPKEFERTRKFKIPPYIQTLIDSVEGDYLVTLSGQALYKRFTRLLDKNGIDGVRFHDLRHLNASVMLQLNIPKKYAKERGGWKTDNIYEDTYGHTFSEERKNVDNTINSYFDLIVNQDKKLKRKFKLIHTKSHTII